MSRHRLTRHARERRDQRSIRERDFATFWSIADAEAPARDGATKLTLTRRAAGIAISARA
jgi:hypothetical protein